MGPGRPEKPGGSASSRAVGMNVTEKTEQSPKGLFNVIGSLRSIMLKASGKILR